MNKVYRVKRNGLYLVETEEFGVYRTSNNKDEAMEFTSTQDLVKYVEYELRLNIANVSVECIEYVEQRSILKSHNGVWYNHDTHYICSRCGKIDNRFNLNPVCTINGEEELCFKCLEALDDSEESWEANV
jgi:hypothetical protein